MSDPVPGNVPDELIELAAKRLKEKFGWLDEWDDSIRQAIAKQVLAVVLPVVRKQWEAELCGLEERLVASDPVPGNVPDELVDLGWAAILTPPLLFGKDAFAAGLAAVLPVVRQQIADEIEALRERHEVQQGDSNVDRGIRIGYEVAARVVRGDP